MNKLENKLGLIELTPSEKVFQEPSSYNLKDVPKKEQTFQMVEFVCKRDGMALKHVSKKLITPELCDIAVSQNGFALSYVPEKIINEENDDWYINLCKKAVSSDGLALQFIPKNIINNDIVETALFIGEYPLGHTNNWTQYPLAYVPEYFLNKELLERVVERVPLCIKNVPKRRVTKKLALIAVEKDGFALQFVPAHFVNKEIVKLAISNNAMAIQYVPNVFLTKEICNECFKRNPAVLGYLPEKYVTKQMCIDAVNSNSFFVHDLSERGKIEYFGNKDFDLVIFDDIPEKFRNDIDVLDAIIKLYKYGSLPLLKWNERLIKYLDEGVGLLKLDKRSIEINPLHEETVTYLETKKIEHERDIDKNIDLSIVEKYVGNAKKLKLPTQRDISPIYTILSNRKNELLDYDFSENEKDEYKIYYISDIHIEHQISEVVKKASKINEDEKEQYISNYIRKKISKMVQEVEDPKSILLIGGDTADSTEVSAFFYNELRKQWGGGVIISVLGNHELWDVTNTKNSKSDDYQTSSVEDIVLKYKKIIHKGFDDDFLSESILLENEVYIRFKDRFTRIISAKDILSTSKKELTDFFSKCTLIILGGIGYSGLNTVFNQSIGLYRETINSLEEDKRRSEAFKKIYDKVQQCASDRRVIVLTHTPVYDWTNDKCNPNWIYVNGHTHKNSICITEDGTTVLSDNQIGYKPVKWNLHSFTLDAQWYDPFEKYKDGIYEITSDEYREFNRGRGIQCKGCSYDGKLYMLKKENMYMFLLESARSLCLMVGGQRNKLSNHDINYYYNNLKEYSDRIKQIISPYQKVMRQISEEIKKPANKKSRLNL